MHVTSALVAVLAPAGVVALGILSMVVAYKGWKIREYLVTNRRILGVKGLLGKKTLDVSLEKITNIELVQSRIARLFRLGYGDIDIRTAHEGSVAVYQALVDVVDFKKAALEAKNGMRPEFQGPPGAFETAALNAMSAAAIPAPPADSSAMAKTPAEITAALAKLADLRDRGAVTAAEYEAKKAEMLARL
jgi:membrane protein YdbS with pleckstrin-like domain